MNYRVIAGGAVAVALIGAAGAFTHYNGGGEANAQAAAEQPVAPEQAAEAALQQVSAGPVDYLGMIPPSNLPTYAPILPDNFVTFALEAPAGPSSGQVEYSTGADPKVVMAFYAKVAAMAGLRAADVSEDEDAEALIATDGRRRLAVKAQSNSGSGSIVNLSYS